jgi:Raf kinase inhibitor-like YbhB/YbcL family protein
MAARFIGGAVPVNIPRRQALAPRPGPWQPAAMLRLIGRLLRNVHAGEKHMAWTDPRLQAPDAIELTSPAFLYGDPMPKRHAGQRLGDNVSPALNWEGGPENAACYVIIMEDPDAPLPKPPCHLIAVLDGRLDGIGEGELAHGKLPALVGLYQGFGGRVGYHGPGPPPGHGPHRYVFQIYASDAPLALKPDAVREDVIAALAGHVTARGRLEGTYES